MGTQGALTPTLPPGPSREGPARSPSAKDDGSDRSEVDPPGSGRGDSCWERPGTHGGDVEVPTVDGQEPGGGPLGGWGGLQGPGRRAQPARTGWEAPGERSFLQRRLLGCWVMSFSISRGLNQIRSPSSGPWPKDFGKGEEGAEPPPAARSTATRQPQAHFGPRALRPPPRGLG